MFITFEGIDGCGKTTQSILLSKYMSGLYGEENVVLTREPGGTSFNEMLRNMFLCSSDYKVDAITELFLFLAMRRESFSKIVKKGLEDSKIVISDRCIDSTVAYQGYGQGVDLELIEKLNSVAVADVTPDITFIIDVDTEKALERATRWGYESDSVDYYSRVRKGFREVAEKNPHRCELISCSDYEKNGDSDIYAIHRRIVELFHIRASEMCV
ncbi:thymidylate kinase [Anaplasma platys]|uniref:Thymidylate kinase n=1 Tax=Anaplasma platys TaxID=949 RepID=A0A858PXC3_9RICK|nr:dTMP kinase [Anaplasma platys]QJC27235.1 thymidylate kinase [Anaplasma platys]